jgi:hypothetical protein
MSGPRVLVSCPTRPTGATDAQPVPTSWSAAGVPLAGTVRGRRAGATPPRLHN